MSTLADSRRRARLVVPPLLGVAAMAYFAYHAVHGDRGLTTWWSLRHAIKEARAELAVVSAERRELEHRVSLLRPDHLHPDMLDEQARRMLNLIGPDEIMVLNAEVAPASADPGGDLGPVDPGQDR
ncbi:FtsB family cell division protein [Roseospira visakhapatnamensis]|uniref:Cell division protein FtsB n=1 Tax=Roseospira visakhapatnamensis TaxID=390880 RepID=A0A7W6RAI3_9PROT|nr:septum formation initiator family protein [Roseospira visakhapatnamensis]MBB4264956.1 cell division protein FtsB [Roseospira visakhapatnamensis]